MKNIIMYLCTGYLVLLASNIHATVNLEKKNRLKYLTSLTLDELYEVEIKLDDVFDVFDGLVKTKPVTIATGAKQSAARAPAVTSVITAQDIEAIGATDLDEVLETVPGLHVMRNNPYRPIYTIRGIFSEYNPEVLMLINGVSINTLYLGDRGIAWGGMPVNAISHVEVIRGPGSAVYGADAFAGVINVVTKTASEIAGTETGGRIGTFNTREGWLVHGSTWKGIEVASSVEYRTTDGQNSQVEADAQTLYDQVFHTQKSFAPGSVNTGTENIDARIDLKKGSWQLRGGYQGRQHAGTGVGLAQALDPLGYADSRRLNADLTYARQLGSHWELTHQLSYLNVSYDAHYVFFPAGAFGGAYPDGYIGNPGASERHLRWDSFAFYSGFKKHLLRLGAGYYNNDQYRVTETRNFGIGPTGQPIAPGSPLVSNTDTPYVFNREAVRNNGYLSLQDVWTLTPQWELTTGIRYDTYSDFGDTINPRIALVWQPRLDFTSKLLYGRAFRAPSFSELYSANNPVSLGNPNLKPETMHSWELALDYQAAQNVHLATNLFTYDIEDKIVFSPDPNGKTNTARNIGHWQGYGTEVEVRWKMNQWSSLLANYSYTRCTDEETQYDIGHYPHHSAYLRTDWLLFPNWYLDLQTHWIIDRHREFGDTRDPIEDYATVDLTLRYKDIRRGHWGVALSARNLFNADAREPSLGPDSRGVINVPNDLPLAGRSYFVELRYTF
jgi:outer membrane receptor protein involved in Fe transport